MERIRCVTWNIHRAKGRDGRIDPGRVMDAIETAVVPYNPDVLALQEADGACRPHARIIDVARIAQMTGLTYMHDNSNLRWGPESDGFLGTILFVNARLRRTHADVIDLPGHCHRGAISVETMCDGRACRIISAHLSLSQVLRIAQMRIIGQYIRRRPVMRTILLGDLNEWRPWGGLAFASRLLGTDLHGPVRPTFPAGLPALPLDRILTDKGGEVREIEVINSAATNAASDHRPLAGVVTVA